MDKKRIPNDEPTLDDLDAVGCGALVVRIGDAVVAASPPQVFGVHGEWGAGKTSFLHKLHYYLTKKCPQNSGDPPTGAWCNQAGQWKELVTVVWFEAWRYQHETAPIVALLQEIRTQLPWAAKALKQSAKLLEVGIRGALLSLEDLTKTIGFQASKVEQAGRDWEDQNLATRLPSHVVREQLDQAIKTLTGKTLTGKQKDHRLVVLVDDLDRCEPECAFRLLEGIKIYLNLPSCVFVLAMNQRIVEEAVAKHLPGAQGEDVGVRRRRAKDYLEKLCTSVYHLPLVRLPADLLQAYLGHAPIWDELCSVIRLFRCLPRVPRKIKAYAGLLLRFDDRLADARKRSQKEYPDDISRWAKVAVIFTYVYHFEHELYRHIWADENFYRLELLPWARQDKEKLLGTIRSRLAVKSGDAGSASLPLQDQFTWQLLDPIADDVLHIQELIVSLKDITHDEWQENLLA